MAHQGLKIADSYRQNRQADVRWVGGDSYEVAVRPPLSASETARLLAALPGILPMGMDNANFRVEEDTIAQHPEWEASDGQFTEGNISRAIIDAVTDKSSVT